MPYNNQQFRRITRKPRQAASVPTRGQQQSQQGQQKFDSLKPFQPGYSAAQGQWNQKSSLPQSFSGISIYPHGGPGVRPIPQPWPQPQPCPQPQPWPQPQPGPWPPQYPQPTQGWQSMYGGQGLVTGIMDYAKQHGWEDPFARQHIYRQGMVGAPPNPWYDNRPQQVMISPQDFDSFRAWQASNHLWKNQGDIENFRWPSVQHENWWEPTEHVPWHQPAPSWPGGGDMHQFPWPGGNGMPIGGGGWPGGGSIWDTIGSGPEWPPLQPGRGYRGEATIGWPHHDPWRTLQHQRPYRNPVVPGWMSQRYF